MSVNLTAGQLGPEGGLAPEALRALRPVGAPSIRPAHPGEVVAVVQEIDGDEYRRRLWWWRPEGGGPAPVDARPPEPGSDVAPAWSPSGARLAFVSDRGGARHLRVTDGDLSESTPVPGADLGGPVQRFIWLDDERLAVVADAPGGVPGTDPAVITWLRYKRDGRSEPFDVPAIVAVVELGGGARTVVRAPGPVTALATTRECLAYVTSDARADDVEERCQLRVCDLATEIDRLSWDCPAPIDALAAAGDHLLAVSRGPDPSYAARRLWAIDLADPPRPPRRVFPGLEASVEYGVIGDARATGPGRRVAVDRSGTVHVVASLAGDVALLRGAVTDSEPRRITPHGACLTDFAAGGDEVAVCLERPEAPVELHRLDRAGAPVRISELSTGWAAAVGLVAPSTLTVTTPDRLTLTAWLSLPAGPGPHPLLVRVHGGPHLCMGNGFNLETQLELAAGFAVLAPNIRGSDGWGDALRAGSVGEWGGADFEDLMACVDAAIATGAIDPDRLYLAGGSYGGYLTNWAITQTGRFRAAIAERSICNLLSKYGTSDNGFDTNRTEMGGADVFDDSVSLLLERSPLRHAAAVTTPVLLIHGERDQRCPIEQSEQWFATLRRLGCEVVLVRYPGESHDYTGAGRPAHRIDRLARILDWLDAHR